MKILNKLHAMSEDRKRNRAFSQLTAKDLAELSDGKLADVLTFMVLVNWPEAKCLKKFKGAKRTFFIITYFNLEIQNGGLCQFFVNSSRLVAPYVSESLAKINAVSYKELFEKFVMDNNIPLNDLDSFKTYTFEQYELQMSRYPFDEFDHSYYKLYEKEPIDDLLLQYAREHLEDFVEKK
jgi:hypothetical protein